MSEPHVSKTRDDRMLELISCTVGRERFGLPIARIREIIRLPKCTAVPEAPRSLLGLTNLRGHVLPVWDLRQRLGMPQTETTNASRVIVVEQGETLTGLLVDAVSEVVRLAMADVEAPPLTTAEQGGKLSSIWGLGKTSSGLLMLLDVDNLLNEVAAVFPAKVQTGEGDRPEEGGGRTSGPTGPAGRGLRRAA